MLSLFSFTTYPPANYKHSGNDALSFAVHHYQYYFTKSGKTMKMTNGEFVETCHSSIRQSEERHGFKVKKKLRTPIHMQKSWQSLVLYNSKRAGHVTPLRLKKKSLSTSSSHTPQPPI